MTDSTDNKSNEKRDQSSLHHRLDLIDKKLKEKRDNLDVDLDAMLNEAESSILPIKELQSDEDDLDRLLMNVEFDEDDDLMQAEMNADARVVMGVEQHDELDDFLGFDSFGEDFIESEKTPSVETEAIEQTVENPDDEDDLDRLLMNTGLDTDDESVQVTAAEDAGGLEELDDFSDFSDFNEPDSIGDEVEASVVTDSEDEELDDFSDFGDFNEPEIIPLVDAEGSDQAGDNAFSHTDDASPLDEDEDLSGLNLFGDDFDELDMIQDAEIETSAPVEADLAVPAVEQQALGDQAPDDDDSVDGVLPDVDFDADDALEQTNGNMDELVADADRSDEVGDIFGLADEFDGSDLIPDDEVSGDLVAPVEEQQPVDDEGALEQSDENMDELVYDAGSSEDDDFSALADKFDESDLIQDDEVEVSALAADLIAPDEQSFDDEDTVGGLVQDEEDGLKQADEAVDELVGDDSPMDEEDDFSGLTDEFDESDSIQDDEVEVAAVAVDLIAPDEQQAAVEESFSDLQDDKNNIDSLLMDAGFEEDEVLEQADGMSEEFGDDADLRKIDNLFQLDEVSDDFSKQIEDVQLEETEKLSAQEDDFLLPDFDITADSEISDMGSHAGIKEDELTDVFGDNDISSEDDDVLAFAPETEELNLGGNQAITEPKPNPTAEDAGNVKLSPFGFEHEDMKKQLQDAESKVKKLKLFGYAALGFGVVALSAAAGLGVMNFGAKTEISKLTETVSSLEASLAKNAANNPSEEINAMRNSVVQLNQQVDGFITELKGNPQSPVDLLNNNVPDIVAKQDMVSKALEMLQVKMGGVEESKIPTVPEPPKVEAVHEPVPAPEKEAHQHEVMPVKPESVHEHAPPKEKSAHEIPPGKETKQEHAPTKERALHETAPAKVVEPPPAKVKTQAEAEAAKPKPITPEKTVVKEEPVKASKQAVPGKWGVNLVAVKHEWYAKSKAAEFARQGIYVEVIPVPGNMYRLRVGGFKTKAEASSNTARIKKALNLDSVWVSDN